jgi:hypothetical protein
MANLGDMVVRIVGDTAGFNKSLNDTQKKMLSFGVNAAAVTAAVVAIGKAAVNATRDFVDYTSAINDASERTGLSTDAIQEWKFIAEQTGTTLESVTGAVGLMTRGLTTNADAFNKLGIVTKNADGSFKSTTEIFNDTIATLSRMTDETERDQMAFKLLGRSAQSLIPILNKGASGIDEMRKSAHDLGIVLSEDAIQKGDTLGDTFDALKASVKSLGLSMLQDATPAIQGVASALANTIEKTLQAKKQYKDFQDFLNGKADYSNLSQLQNALIGIDKQIKQVAGDTRIPDSVKAQLAKDRATLLMQIKEAELIQKQALMDQGDTERAAAAKIAAEKKAVQDAANAEELAARKKTLDEKLLLEEESAARQKTLADDYAMSVQDTEIAIIESRRETARILQELEQQTFDDAKLKADALAEAWRGAVESIVTVSKAVFETLGENIAQGELDWKDLGTAAINAIGSIVSAMGDQLASKAAATLIEAIAATFNPFLAWAAPGLYSSAAILGGGAAAAWAAGAALKNVKLAEGGVVQPVAGGVQATIAEAGMAEAVIPLDRLDRMLASVGGGGSGGGMTKLIVNLDSKPLLDTIFDATKNRTVLIDSGAVV